MSEPRVALSSPRQRARGALLAYHAPMLRRTRLVTAALLAAGAGTGLWLVLSACASSGPPAVTDLGAAITLAGPDETGEPMLLAGRVLGADGVTPLAGARLRVYQTDVEGFYCKGPLGLELGQSRARLSGWLQTEGAGRYEVRSIKPSGYPDADVPAHVHIEVRAEGYPVQEHTLYIEHDPRLTEDLRRAVAEDGRGAILPLARGADGVLRCAWDLVAVRDLR